MNYLGIGKGLYKTLEGVMEGDIVKIGKGALQTAGSIAGSVIFGSDNNESVVCD